MSNFPKRYCLPDGSIYEVAFEDVKRDWADTARQYDDLSNEEQEKLIEGFDEEHALSWMADQWYGNEILVWGRDTGEVDEKVRKEGISNLKYLCKDEWAGDYEISSLRATKQH